eukprot:gb/GECG01006796.1/.p1 GENE.gb/GECG01006796.1/~~gb/GECG01006796.1/.p1  ORF type:complete len:630 (+),score=98.72 gb/GECG01006796.1/:1-1890(+)
MMLSKLRRPLMAATSRRILCRNASSSTTAAPEGVDEPALEGKKDDEFPSFARALFRGDVTKNHVYPYPEILTKEASEMLSMFIDPMDKFFKETNDAAKNDETAQVPPEITEALKEMGAFGLQVPEELDGVGLNNTSYARLIEVCGAYDLGMGIYLGAHQSIGFKGILLFGNDAQRKKYLPPLAKGEKIAAFALTEPSSGSDANSIRTKAVLNDAGTHYILNGGKIWISNGGIADVFTVFAQTPVKDEKTGETKNKVSAFIVERDFGGITSGPPENKMGIKCSNTAEVSFEDVHIPVENLLGEVGEGFKVAMEILNNGRFGMGAALSGTMKGVIKGVTEHAASRKQFGYLLKDFDLIRGKIANMEMKCYAAESMAYAVAGNMDRGAKDYQLEAAVSKIFASEAAWYVADEGIQVLGGAGYMKDLPYERILRDLRIFRIFEGTNDILRMFIALTGLQSLGKDLKPVSDAMKNPMANIPTLLPEAISMMKRRFGIYDNPTVDWAPKALAPAADCISKSTGLFGAGAKDLLMKYNKKVIEQQMELERVADCVIDIYAMAATTARATRAVDQGLETADHEVMLANAFAKEAARRVQQNVARITGSGKDIDDWKKKISDNVCERGEYVPTHPLGF